MTYSAFAPLAPLRTALLQSVFTVAGIGLLLVAITLVAGGFITNRMLQPIRQLRQGAALIGGGDLTQRISVNTGDELEALANQFNDMAGKLEESYAGLEQKVAQRTHVIDRIAATADRHRRRAQGHQPLDVRSADGARHAGRIGRAGVRGGKGIRIPARGRHLSYCRKLRLLARLRGVHGASGHRAGGAIR